MKKEWLEGYYPPFINKEEGYSAWTKDWSMGPSAEPDWVWFVGDYYSESDAREYLEKNRNNKEMLKSDEDK